MNNSTKQYKQLFNIIRDELNTLDPLGVVLDNPNLNDEYDLETQEIILLLKEDLNYKTLATKICDIFVKTTNMDFLPKTFEPCAKNILQKTKKL